MVLINFFHVIKNAIMLINPSEDYAHIIRKDFRVRKCPEIDCRPIKCPKIKTKLVFSVDFEAVLEMVRLWYFDFLAP